MFPFFQIRSRWRTAREGLQYVRHLSNGFDVWIRHRRQQPLPPLQFRNGISWQHGTHDDPIMLFRELYLEEFFAPVGRAPHNAVIFDIGANIGATVLYWAARRPDLTFHAFEPNPQAFGTLEANIVKNGVTGQAHLHQQAVAGKAGAIDLWIDVPTVLSTAYGKTPAAGGRKVTVPAITLETAWREASAQDVWLLKIDVEGAEGDILEAAADGLLRQAQHMVVEWHDNIVPGVGERCRRRLRDAGFTFSERLHPWNEGILYATRC